MLIGFDTTLHHLRVESITIHQLRHLHICERWRAIIGRSVRCLLGSIAHTRTHIVTVTQMIINYRTRYDETLEQCRQKTMCIRLRFSDATSSCRRRTDTFCYIVHGNNYSIRSAGVMLFVAPGRSKPKRIAIKKFLWHVLLDEVAAIVHCSTAVTIDVKQKLWKVWIVRGQEVFIGDFAVVVMVAKCEANEERTRILHKLSSRKCVNA